MTDILVNNWQLLVSIGAVVCALVVFGKNLADLILKWRDVFGENDKVVKKVDSSLGASVEDEKDHSLIRRGITKSGV